MITQEDLNGWLNKIVYIENCNVPILNNCMWKITAALLDPPGHDYSILAFMDINYTPENGRWYTIECDQERLKHLYEVMKENE